MVNVAGKPEPSADPARPPPSHPPLRPGPAPGSPPPPGRARSPSPSSRRSRSAVSAAAGRPAPRPAPDGATPRTVPGAGWTVALGGPTRRTGTTSPSDTRHSAEPGGRPCVPGPSGPGSRTRDHADRAKPARPRGVVTLRHRLGRRRARHEPRSAARWCRRQRPGARTPGSPPRQRCTHPHPAVGEGRPARSEPGHRVRAPRRVPLRAGPRRVAGTPALPMPGSHRPKAPWPRHPPWGTAP